MEPQNKFFTECLGSDPPEMRNRISNMLSLTGAGSGFFAEGVPIPKG